MQEFARKRGLRPQSFLTLSLLSTASAFGAAPPTEESGPKNYPVPARAPAPQEGATPGADNFFARLGAALRAQEKPQGSRASPSEVSVPTSGVATPPGIRKRGADTHPPEIAVGDQHGPGCAPTGDPFKALDNWFEREHAVSAKSAAEFSAWADDWIDHAIPERPFTAQTPERPVPVGHPTQKSSVPSTQPSRPAAAPPSALRQGDGARVKAQNQRGETEGSDHAHDATSKNDVRGQNRASSTDQKLSEARNRERVLLQIEKLQDGELGPVVGFDTARAEFRGAPLFQILGISTKPEAVYDGAALLAAQTGYPVVPINNATNVANLSELLASSTDSVPGTLTRRLEDVVANVFGKIADIGRAVTDRVLPASYALEPATRTLALLLHERAARGANTTIVAHSQGTVIAQNAAILLAERMAQELQAGVISEEQARLRLGSVTVIATGSFATSESWPAGIRVVELDTKDDVIASLGGHNEWWQREGQDFRFQSHNYRSHYVPMIADALRKLESNTPSP